MEEIKICTKCKQGFPATTDYFYRVGGRTINGNKKGYLRPICKKCHTKQSVRNARRRKYLMDTGAYNKLSSKQGNVCFICKHTCSTGSGLSVDHDHETGLIRGLLCHGCNTGLGKFQESAYILLRAAWYVLINKIKGWFI